MRRDVCLRTQCECVKRTLSSWALSAGILVSMNRQLFADCDTTDVGCNEGLMNYTSMFAERSASMSRYTGYKPNNASSDLKHWRIHEHVSWLPVDDANWAISPVKHQEQCGSCWTSTTMCFESVWSIASGKLLTLSEQQLVVCITVESGCNGTLTNRDVPNCRRKRLVEDVCGYH